MKEKILADLETLRVIPFNEKHKEKAMATMLAWIIIKPTLKDFISKALDEYREWSVGELIRELTVLENNPNDTDWESYSHGVSDAISVVNGTYEQTRKHKN